MHLENCPTLLCVNDIWRFRTAGHTASFSHHFSISHAGVSPPAWGTRTQAWSPRIHHCLHAEQIIDLPPTGGSRRLLYPACCRGPFLQYLFHIFRYWRRKNNVYKKQRQPAENNVIQNRFTAYLLTAIHRKKATYLGACSKRREMELPTDPDDIVSVLDAMVNSAGDAPSPFPLFENDALEEALQKLSQRDRYIFLCACTLPAGLWESGVRVGIDLSRRSHGISPCPS